MKYRKKPFLVDAIQYTGKNKDEIINFCHENCNFKKIYNFPNECCVLETQKGPTEVKENEWIIRGIHGEYYICQNDIFNELYDPVIEQIEKEIVW